MNCILVVLILICGWPKDTVSGVVKHRNRAALRSPPLDNVNTIQQISNLAQAAQQLDFDTKTRLIPSFKHAKKSNLHVCCLHANILDFYLWNILTTDDEYPDLDKVRSDLARVSRDLSEQGCSVEHVDDHEYSKKFKEGFHKLGKTAVTKAIGEIDILFDALNIFC